MSAIMSAINQNSLGFSGLCRWSTSAGSENLLDSEGNVVQENALISETAE
jgi:hypothetical protein